VWAEVSQLLDGISGELGPGTGAPDEGAAPVDAADEIDWNGLRGD
jgi:hypothetical protein